MVRGYHVIFGTYGFWLPNDPCGSWSDFVGKWELACYGSATKTKTRQSVARVPHDHAKRINTKSALQYPAVVLDGIQARAIDRGFARFARKSQLTIWACSILPQHVHLVIARQQYGVEQAVNLLKGEATRKLVEERVHPLAQFETDGKKPPHPWARGLWKVFLESDDDIRRAIRYVADNPTKENKPRQRWRFVTPFGDTV